MKKVLLLDNYDSFTYNLVHTIKKVSDCKIDVFRNDEIELQKIEQYDKIILSPGPGIPSEAGLLLDIIKHYYTKKSILGVCLGHQAIGEAMGSKLMNLTQVYHGLAIPINIINPNYLFEGIPSRFLVGRYHSWVIDLKSITHDLIVTGIDDENLIMSISHKDYDVHGVQFHPESILTEYGEKLISNFINN